MVAYIECSLQLLRFRPALGLIGCHLAYNYSEHYARMSCDMFSYLYACT